MKLAEAPGSMNSPSAIPDPIAPATTTSGAKRPGSLVLLLLSLSVLAGCYSFSTLQEPQTLKPGGLRLAPKVRVVPSEDPFEDETNIGVSAELDVRVGLVPRLELQVGAGTSSLARVGLKGLLVDWEHLRLAVVPTYQIQTTREDSDYLLDEDFLPEYLTQSAIVPLVAGIPLASSLDLLLGADVHAGRRLVRRGEANQSGGFLALGAHLGFAVYLGNNATLIPQCGVLATVASKNTPPSFWEGADGGGYEIDDLRRGNMLWECALGGSFGNAYKSRDTQ